MNDRIQHSYQTFLYDYIREVLIICPKCSDKAKVWIDDFSFRNFEEKEVKLSCLKCGFNKSLLENPTLIITNSINQEIEGSYLVMGSSIDPFFHQSLWLKIEMKGEILWAYNYDHLDFIKNHVEARLRERNGQEFFNKSLGSRLPKWLTSKKNRREVLKSIAKLEKI